MQNEDVMYVVLDIIRMYCTTIHGSNAARNYEAKLAAGRFRSRIIQPPEETMKIRLGVAHVGWQSTLFCRSLPQRKDTVDSEDHPADSGVDMKYDAQESAE